MGKLLFIVLVLCLFIAPMDADQVSPSMTFSFGVHYAKPVLGFFLMQVTCNSSKQHALMSVEVGSDGEERIIVQRLEYDSNVCPSAPRPEETVIDIDPDHSQTVPSSPYVGEGCNYSDMKYDSVDYGVRGYPRRGPGGGGGGPDGGGGGPGGGEPNGNSDSDCLSNGRNKRNGDGLSLKNIHVALQRLAKVSIFITAQTGTTLLFVASSTPKPILYSIVAINVCSYLFCMFSFVAGESNPLVRAIIPAVGSLLAALGFLLTMCLIIPPEFIWLLFISAIIIAFSLSVLSFR